MAARDVLIGAFVAAFTILAVDARQAATSPDVASLPTEPITQPWTGDFDGMVRRRVVRILTPYSKTHYFIEKGVARGIVYDFGMKIEGEINRILGTRPAAKVHVVFVPTERHRLHQALVEGRGDIIGSNLSVTPEWTQRVDFTVPGQTNVDKILVTGPQSRTIARVADLAGMPVSVREGSAELEGVLAMNVRLTNDGHRPAVVRVLPRDLEDEGVLEMVHAGLVEASVIDDVIGRFWAGVLPGLTLHRDIVVQPGVAIAWAVRKNSPGLLAVLNPIVEANKVGTLFGNMALQTYLRSATSVKRGTSLANLARFRRLQEIFRRYARRYDVDYLLMMAQAFQESGLDHRATSSRGALGVMQVMPATGLEMNVGDIRQLEANVHAGVKYVRVIMDRHLHGASMNRLDMTLFAFAAYNCGPERLRRLRRETARRGLDPDVWFNNVEQVAGEVVGRQTVDYVSNIYKYYVAYKLTIGATP